MKILEIGLIAGAGYLLLKSGILSSLTGTTAAASSGGTTMTSNPVNPSAPPPGALDTLSLVRQRAAGASSLTFDQWNYLYSLVRGTPGPDPSVFLIPDQRGKLLSINEWWAYIQSAGMNGLGILARAPRGMSGFAPLSIYPPQNYSAPAPEDSQPGGFLPPGGVGMGRFIWG